MTVRSVGLWVLGLLALYALISVLVGLWRASRLPAHWRALAAKPVPENALHLLALGDSAMQGIGADRPGDGIAGLTASYIETQTGRPVHLSNLARGGAAVRQVLEQHLPDADLGRADLVLVVTSNDLEKRVPLDRYRADLRQLLAALPASRTVISDLPLMPGRAPYQQVLASEADRLGVVRADFAAVFSRARRLDIFSWLPPHLNSCGYALWFEAFRPPIEKISERLLGDVRFESPARGG